MKLLEQKNMLKAQTVAQKLEVLAQKYLSSELVVYYMFGSIIAFIAPIAVLMLWVLIFMFIDFVTGIWASIKKGYVIRSRKLRRSITKGVFYLLFVLLLQGMDEYVLTFSDLNLANIGGSIICSIELYSILENMYNITKAKTFKILTRWIVLKIEQETKIDMGGNNEVNKKI